MAKRKVRKTKTRKMKTHKRKTRKVKSRRKTSKKTVRRKKGSKSPVAMSMEKNRKAHWEAYKHLQKRCDQAWAKLKADTKRKAAPEVIIRGKNHLLLLLGECDYMARECMRMAARRQKR